MGSKAGRTSRPLEKHKELTIQVKYCISQVKLNTILKRKEKAQYSLSIIRILKNVKLALVLAIYTWAYASGAQI